MHRVMLKVLFKVLVGIMLKDRLKAFEGGGLLRKTAEGEALRLTP